ncbi:MlaE family lipid ABC transporter permease subunit [Candidatus Saccharibacteria bacterium]|nr:MlaE family lipid ABC transporter permease subunit [Calditrichia bacterium]NIV72558.1 MlaE family lipid ABC transporter permease subunit [Calditrichia bacterium]NIV99665.1 MlaE family lipid ABC transporter permease subunit [Candidatus Saccharibacteria bacterium]NIW79982.1 MlaE family lipid ABC transporter permease subunit [Calditrichia bacterium]
MPNLLRLIEKRPRKFLTIDLSGVNQIDSAGVIALQHLQLVARRNNIRVKLSGISSKIQQVIDSFSDVEQREPSIPQKTRILERIGGKVYFFLQESLPAFMFLLADITVWTVKDLFRSKAHRKGEFINQAILIGVNAVPLVMLITFLVGLVLALQSAQQLRQFGANVFVADLTVIAMTREMGPLLTAIMIAGRSGSAIASEIATMVVTEEVDALKSMALNPTRYVVIPKMHASLFTLPLLTVIADIFGILGGVLIAYLYLDVSPTIFYNRMVEVLFFKDILTGIIKSIIFAAAIVLTGSFYGFRARGGSESVGRATTQAVVTAIFLVILTDSILGLILY